MARSGNNARIPAIGNYSQASAPKFGADLTELADDIADLIGESFDTVGALPSSGNWPGRTARVASDGLQHVHNGTAWTDGTGDTGWITPTALGSGWSNESGNGFQYRRRNGEVRFRGRGSSTGASSALFTLPAGFLPDVLPGANFAFLTDAQSGAVRMNVLSTGAMTSLTTGTITNISLGNIRFDAA
ncbi:hypothetical protein [Cryobacterium psychrophilum]|uniref:Uncharacterized protein n=1 Tax=Cryobacterium psychrophilum TaxID=41988 RepID=A0A4Y8KWI9_9MICO|nr:hypothetical protein [Cryobacterium psychrophilum]TDW31029.1 hypothetical protein EDD25_2817 [Cryobacterium psychrophilum]TFD80881.1 hypothetical protein E3T53_04475 [Cryobacterium psychrophilum]